MLYVCSFFIEIWNSTKKSNLGQTKLITCFPDTVRPVFLPLLSTFYFSLAVF